MGLRQRTFERVDPARNQEDAMLHTADDVGLGLMVRGNIHNRRAGIAQTSPDATLVDVALAILEKEKMHKLVKTNT